MGGDAHRLRFPVGKLVVVAVKDGEEHLLVIVSSTTHRIPQPFRAHHKVLRESLLVCVLARVDGQLPRLLPASVRGELVLHDAAFARPPRPHALVPLPSTQLVISLDDAHDLSDVPCLAARVRSFVDWDTPQGMRVWRSLPTLLRRAHGYASPFPPSCAQRARGVCRGCARVCEGCCKLGVACLCCCFFARRRGRMVAYSAGFHDDELELGAVGGSTALSAGEQQQQQQQRQQADRWGAGALEEGAELGRLEDEVAMANKDGDMWFQDERKEQVVQGGEDEEGKREGGGGEERDAKEKERDEQQWEDDEEEEEEEEEEAEQAEEGKEGKKKKAKGGRDQYGAREAAESSDEEEEDEEVEVAAPGEGAAVPAMPDLLDMAIPARLDSLEQDQARSRRRSQRLDEPVVTILPPRTRPGVAPLPASPPTPSVPSAAPIAPPPAAVGPPPPPAPTPSPSGPPAPKPSRPPAPGAARVSSASSVARESRGPSRLSVEQRVQDVEATMAENIQRVVDRGERLEVLMRSEDLSMQASEFYKRSRRLKRRNTLKRVVSALLFPIVCTLRCVASVARGVAARCKRKRAFDDLFADQEMAFKALASVLCLLLPAWDEAYYHCPPPPPRPAKRCPKGAVQRMRWEERVVQYDKWATGKAMKASALGNTAAGGASCVRACARALCTVLTWVFGVVVGVPLATAVAVGAFLPAFFLLLLARTTTVESDTKKFNVRQDKIVSETKKKQSFRVFRFLSRTTPMLAFVTAWPVAVVRLQQSDVVSNATADALLVAHVCLVLLLQCLGTARAMVSWLDRQRRESDEDKHVRRSAGAPALTNLKNIIAFATLGLEFAQLCTFPLKHLDHDEEGHGDGDTDVKWAPHLFRLCYGLFLSHRVEVLCWGAVGGVALLVAVFVVQFVKELRAYGLYLRAGNTAVARDYFFWSFVGAVVFGHGHAKHVGAGPRLCISLLADTLFISVAFHLLQALVCTRVDANTSVLVAEPSLQCWHGEHLWLSQAAIVAFTYYVCLSVMVAPLLISDTPPSSVRFVKAYLMFAVLMKTTMLAASALANVHVGPTASAVVAFAVCSLLLAASGAWYTRVSRDHPGWWFASFKLVSRWKICAYAAGAASAAIAIAVEVRGEGSVVETSLPVWAAMALLPFVWHFRRVLLCRPAHPNEWIVGRDNGEGSVQVRAVLVNLTPHPLQ